jgi:hypothetical protein
MASSAGCRCSTTEDHVVCAFEVNHLKGYRCFVEIVFIAEATLRVVDPRDLAWQWWRGDDGARKLDGQSWWSKMTGQLVNPKRRFW